MVNRLKGLFGKPAQKKQFSDEDYQRDYERKNRWLEQLLGSAHSSVLHSIIPFVVGGNVDLYPFEHVVDGTAYGTMEVVEPDGTGPKPSRIGVYELVMCTREKIVDGAPTTTMEGRVSGILSMVALYSREAVLNPGDTLETPGENDKPGHCLVLDEWKKPGVEFSINRRECGLILVIEIHRSEMEYAMKNGSQSLFALLKDKGYYPYSDLDRDPVA
jgi:hypothetical protein